MFLLYVAVLILLVWVARLQGRIDDLGREVRRQAPRPAAPAPAPVVPAPEPTSPSPPSGPLPPVPPAQAQPPEEPAGVPPAAPLLSEPPEPQSPLPLPPAPAPARAARTARTLDWEALVGVTLFSWIAGIALALGGIFFLRYSIQNGWLQPPVRLAMGVVAGIALLLACETRWARRYAITANALAAAGLVILFSSFYAAYALWQLLGALPAFVALVAVAALAVLLSLRHDSLFVALLGLLGGFAAPALLSSGQDRPFTLFGYLLLLDAGLGVVSYRKRWAALVALSIVFTTLYQWSWVLTFLSPERAGLALGIFTAFPLLSWGLLWWSERSPGRGGGGEDRFRAMAAANAALPLLLALYLATAPGYGARFPMVFGFLFVVDAALLVIARRRGPQELHALGAATTVLVFLQWWGVSAPPEGRWRALLAFVALFVLFYLWAHRRARVAGRPFTGLAGRAALAAPLLLFMFPALALSEPGFASPALPLAVLIMLTAAVAAHSLGEDELLPYFVAAWLAFGWAVIWTGRHVRPANHATAALVYVVVALFFVAVPLAARRLKGESSPLAGMELLALAPQALLLPLAVQRGLPLPPWALFSAAAAIQAACSGAALALPSARVHAGAVVLSSLVLMAWTLRAGPAASGFAAMAGAAILAGFAMAWREVAAWRRHAAGRGFDGAAAAALALGQVVLAFASITSGRPATSVVAAYHLLLAAGWLALAARSNRLWLPVVGVVPAALGALSLAVTRGGMPGWVQPVAVALPVYALFAAYPLLIAPRLGGSLGPHVAAVLASAAFFTIAKPALEAGGYGGVLGLLPLCQAGLLGILLAALLRHEPAGARNLPRLAVVTAALLTFVTVAVPVQFDRQWVTVGWAVEGAGLAWVYTRVRQRPLLWTALGLLAVSVLKGFLSDMARLGGLYRVASFVGLAVCLALAAVVLQRFVFSRRGE